MVELSQATLRVRLGGSGEPVLLLHGHPRTHVTWHMVAEALSSNFTVVCPDLRGFGQSTVPEDTKDHSNSSKCAKANDRMQLMQRFGFDRFAVAGHDRGSYTAFRLAMDHPRAVSRLVILDGFQSSKRLSVATRALPKPGGTGSSMPSKRYQNG